MKVVIVVIVIVKVRVYRSFLFKLLQVTGLNECLSMIILVILSIKV